MVDRLCGLDIVNLTIPAITMPDLLKQLNHACVNEDKMVWVEGIKLSEILGLSETWPE